LMNRRRWKRSLDVSAPENGFNSIPFGRREEKKRAKKRLCERAAADREKPTT
jgi:hypothetical protein